MLAVPGLDICHSVKIHQRLSCGRLVWFSFCRLALHAPSEQAGVGRS